MEGIFACEERDALAALAGDWNRLAAIEPLYTPMFSDLDEIAASPEVRVCLAGRRSGGVVTHLAVFVTAIVPRGYWLGPKRLFTMSLRTAKLFGNTMLGQPDEGTALAMLEQGLGTERPDMLVFEDLPETSALIGLAQSRRMRAATRILRHNTARRLIVLPESMSDYWTQLRPSTAKAARRDLRQFQRLNPIYTRFDGDDAITQFLPRAAVLGALSHQAGLGFAILNDAGTRELFRRLIRDGRLRCYLVSIDGTAAAFAWGDIAHDVFYFRMTGYNSTFASHSPGKAIIIEVVRDLIECSSAHVFDFGVRDMSYKERLSTMSIATAHLLVAKGIRGRIALALDDMFYFAKTRASKWLGREYLARLQRRLRP